MSEAKVEVVFWFFGLLLTAVTALFPEGLIRLLGRGRVNPSPGVFLFFRILAGFCFFGMFYRLFAVYQRL